MRRRLVDGRFESDKYKDIFCGKHIQARARAFAFGHYIEYCLDEIRSQDIDVAKQNNMGIILINSNKYKQDDKRNINPFQHDQFNYNYFDGSYEKDKFEARR